MKSVALLQADSGKAPKTAKGHRTRAKILDAALAVMARDGFLAARIQDVATEAGVALGTVYTYFDDKSDLLAALVDEVAPDLFAGSRQHFDRTTEAEVMYAAVYRYLDTYRRHRDLFELLAQATIVDERFRDYWFAWRGRVMEGMRRGFTAAKKTGDLDVPGDVVLWASAIGGLVHNYATVWFGTMEGERHDGKPFRENVTVEESALLLTRIIVRALNLEDLPQDFQPPKP